MEDFNFCMAARFFPNCEGMEKPMSESLIITLIDFVVFCIVLVFLILYNWSF